MGGAGNGSKQPGYPSGQQAEHQRGGDGQEPVASKKAKLKVTWQATKTDFAQPRHQAIEQNQRQKNHQQPAPHQNTPGVWAGLRPVVGPGPQEGARCTPVLKGMGAVSVFKAHGRPSRATAQHQHLEQLAHFVLMDELHRLRSLGQA